MFRNALISVSDKTGIVELGLGLARQGTRILSTGGTAKVLREAGLTVVDVSEQTGFPEVMDGRVKTLHPRVHMALLARENHEGDRELLRLHELEAIDLVVCNLYPFEKAMRASLMGARDPHLLESIDVGGPSMIRAAAKNFTRVTVVVSPQDYGLLQGTEELNLQDRQKLAGKAFSHIASYDSVIASALTASDVAPAEDAFKGSQELCFPARIQQRLRYGENPHQWANWYLRPGANSGWQNAEILQGKELSFNNILDLDSAVRCLAPFDEPTAVCVKHNNPCGVASHDSLDRAVELALSADPLSVFGGIVACNGPIGRGAAAALTSVFLECVVAADFSAEALEILSSKKNLRLLRWPELTKSDSYPRVLQVLGGWLVQSPDSIEAWTSDWKVIPSAGQEIPETVKSDAAFAWKSVAALKSNAIAISKNKQTIGLGMGQVNRVDSVEQAIRRMSQYHFGLVENSVLASDAFFPFPDSIEIVAKAGIRYVVQPGGSRNDDTVLAAAKSLGVTMILTSKRHFRH